MYIGSLLSPESPVQFQFHAFHIDSKLPFPPTSENGKGWEWKSLLDTGIDLCAEGDQNFYLDELQIIFSPESAITSLEVLEPDSEKSYRLIGKWTASDHSPSKPVVLWIGQWLSRICIRLHACLKDIQIESLNLTGSVWDTPLLYPVPQKVEFDKKLRVKSINFTRVAINNTNDSDLLFVQKQLASQLSERTHRHISLQTDLDGLPIRVEKMNIPDPEGYQIHVNETECQLNAATRAGLLYGMERLIQLLSAEEIPCCQIEDAPRTSLRGFHLGLPPREDFDFFKRMIRSLLVPMGYNTLFLQVTAGMRYDRHPEINEAWLTANTHSKNGEWPKLPHGDMVADGCILSKQEVRDLVDYARSFGMEVIPEIHSLSHVQYITLAHPELAETDPEKQSDTQLDTRLADQLPASFYKHSCCPLNEDYYRILFDIIDEVTEVIQPKEYVHMGHDEVYQIGICPKCRGKNPADLLALHINRVHDYLAQKGYKMMMWADMLQPDSGYQTPPAIDKIPRDITMLDFIWYFHPEKDLEDNLLRYDFPVVMGNLYSSHYPRYESRITKPGIIGAQLSCWCRSDEKILGREGKLYDLLFSANMLWSRAYRSDIRGTWNQMVCRLLPAIRSALHGIPSPSLDPTAALVQLSLNGSSALIPNSILAGLYTQTYLSYRHATLSVQHPVAASFCRPVRIFPNGKVRSLILGMAAFTPLLKEPWEAAPLIAKLMITYTDGSHDIAEIRYGEQIGFIGRPYATPMPYAYYRHTGYQATYFSDPILEGKDAAGEDLTLYGWEWINESGKSIRSAEIIASEQGTILVACAAAVQ